MQQKQISFNVNVYRDVSELETPDQELMEKAVEAKSNAYAPYSNFKVGAAVRMENGEIILGNNQENASYPSGLCAERVAVFQAKALYPESPIISIAISASTAENPIGKPAAPCGNCRQAIAEYEQHQDTPIKLLLRGETGSVYECQSMLDLLPLSFDSSYLNSNADTA